MSDLAQTVERWVEHGGAWRCSPTRTGSIEIELCSCAGETQERLAVHEARIEQRLRGLEAHKLRTGPLGV
jgi:hypothetical protein